jgi:type III secretion protein L
MVATAEVLRADRAEAVVSAFEDIGRKKAEAERYLAEARAVFETERAKGALAGQRAGASEARQLLDEAGQAVRSLMESLEPEIALLAVALAERILGQFDDRELMVRAAMRAIADLREEEDATIHIAPRYLDGVRERLALRDGGPDVTIEVAAEPGTCAVVTARGSIDASIGRQLETLRQTVRAWARGAGS